MNEVVAWVGSWMFALCALPQAIYTMKVGTAKGVSALFITMWTIGELCMLHAYWGDAPLMFNYISNLLCISPIIYYKIKEM